MIHCVNLLTEDEDFIFTQEEEKSAECEYATALSEYLFEPNAAILKAGAFKSVAKRYGLLKLDKNTHLYTSSALPDSFPGRIWRIQKSCLLTRLQKAHGDPDFCSSHPKIHKFPIRRGCQLCGIPHRVRKWLCIERSYFSFCHFCEIC